MLTKNDLKAIEKLLEPIKKILRIHDKKFEGLGKGFDQIDERLAPIRSGVVNIERDITTALELRQDVKEVRQRIEDHEERISHLEKFP